MDFLGPELTDSLLGLCPPSREARLLDVGCGKGRTVRLLNERERGLQAWGVDLTPGRGDRLLSGDAAQLPFGPSSFEGVLFECSLSVIRDPDAALREAARVLVPDGILYVADLYALEEPKELSATLGRAERWETLLRRFSGAGFRLLGFEDRSAALISLWATLLFEGAVDCRLPSGFRAGYFLAALEKRRLSS